jgi:hypothetical protein
MNVIIMESCHSTWVFDPRRLQFRRILKGIEVGGHSVCTDWRPYWDLEIDPRRETFTVVLDEARTRLIRSLRHNAPDCVHCGAYETMELSLEDILRAVA